MNQVSNADQINQELNLVDLFLILWKSKLIIIFISGIFAFGSVYYALSLPNIYKSDSLLKVGSDKPPSSKSTMGILGAIGFDKGELANKANDVKITVRARDFTKHLLETTNILPNLMALKEYDPATKAIIYNETLYSLAEDKWIGPIPSFLDIHKKFISTITFEVDPDSYLINMGVKHQSPEYAATLLSLVIDEINAKESRRAILNADQALVYLERELAITKIQDIRNSINALIQAQLETKMLANVRKDYLIRTIDSVYIPEKKFAPGRAILCISGTIIGFILAVMFVLVRQFYFTRTES